MVNALAVVILAGSIIFAIRGSVKHFRGEGGCCGGSSPKPTKKKLRNQVIQKIQLQIEGMRCENCANRVVREINDIEGASAKVNLRKKTAEICCDREIDREILIGAIQKAGYEVCEKTKG